MKHLLTFLLAVVLLFCSSCKSKKQVLDKPEDLISRSTMVNIIADSYIIESTVHLAPDSLDRRELTRQYYKELFNRYKITREQFIHSIDYYVSEESSAEKLLSDASELVTKKRKEHNVPENTVVGESDGSGIPESAVPTPIEKAPTPVENKARR